NTKGFDPLAYMSIVESKRIFEKMIDDHNKKQKNETELLNLTQLRYQPQWGMELNSAYRDALGDEPEFTTWKKRAGGVDKHTIDYIFYQKHKNVYLSKILSIPTEKEITFPLWLNLNLDSNSNRLSLNEPVESKNDFVFVLFCVFCFIISARGNGMIFCVFIWLDWVARKVYGCWFNKQLCSIDKKTLLFIKKSDLRNIQFLEIMKNQIEDKCSNNFLADLTCCKNDFRTLKHVYEPNPSIITHTKTHIATNPDPTHVPRDD
ncbi:hypothetical protein RFI_06508, partial [Reticulomyxa filosa]